MTCEQCKWWDNKDSEIGLGKCRVRSPKEVTTYDSVIYGVWPETDIADWCGEFKEKKE